MLLALSPFLGVPLWIGQDSEGWNRLQMGGWLYQARGMDYFGILSLNALYWLHVLSFGGLSREHGAHYIAQSFLCLVHESFILSFAEMVEGSWERKYRDWATTGWCGKLWCACARSRKERLDRGATAAEIEQRQTELRRAVPNAALLLHMFTYTFAM